MTKSKGSRKAVSTLSGSEAGKEWRSLLLRDSIDLAAAKCRAKSPRPWRTARPFREEVGVRGWCWNDLVGGHEGRCEEGVGERGRGRGARVRVLENEV